MLALLQAQNLELDNGALPLWSLPVSTFGRVETTHLLTQFVLLF